MKRAFLHPLLLCLAVYITGCTTTDLRNVTEGTLVLTGVEQERAARIADSGSRAAGAATGRMSFERERDIGGSIAVKSFTDQGALHPSEELQRYVATVGLAIVRQTPRAGMPFAFAVVDREDANAWAAPGGYVFVTSGALRRMDDEAQLAGVLAHEIAHVTREHMVRMLSRTQFLQGVTETVQAASGKDLSELNRAVENGVTILFERGLDRDMEFEADLVGLEYAALAGYDPHGLVDFLENLKAELAAQSAGAGWLGSTHPTLDARLMRLRAHIQNEIGDLGGARVPDRFQRIKARTLGS